MTDDRFKDAGQFQPEKAWAQIAKADADREREAELGTLRQFVRTEFPAWAWRYGSIVALGGAVTGGRYIRDHGFTEKSLFACLGGALLAFLIACCAILLTLAVSFFWKRHIRTSGKLAAVALAATAVLGYIAVVTLY